MNLFISKAELTRLIGATAKVVESRNTMPILSNVRLVATTDGDSGGKLTVTATDLDIVMTASGKADVETAGAICVDAKLLGDIARKAGGDINISLDGDRMVVKSGRSRFSLQTLPVEDFPTLDGGTYTASFDLDIASLFEPVAFAMAVNDPQRHYLEGIYLHVIAGRIVAVATNGHRLARHAGQASDEFNGVILGTKAVGLIGNIPGVAKVSLNEDKLRIEAGDLVMTTKLVCGTYPDYQRVIPIGNPLVAGVDKSAMLKAADRVVVVSNERGNAVRLSVSPGSVALSVRGDAGEAQDEVEADYSGEPIEVGINSIYMRDALSVFPDGAVNVAFADSMSPVHLTSTQAPDLDVTLMPMRV